MHASPRKSKLSATVSGRIGTGTDTLLDQCMQASTSVSGMDVLSAGIGCN